MAEKRPSRARNLTIVGFTALTPLVSVGIILGALFIGLWLDAGIGQPGLITVCLLVVSIPISLVVMVWLILQLIRRLPPPLAPSPVIAASHNEEESFGDK